MKNEIKIWIAVILFAILSLIGSILQENYYLSTYPSAGRVYTYCYGDHYPHEEIIFHKNKFGSVILIETIRYIPYNNLEY